MRKWPAMRGAAVAATLVGAPAAVHAQQAGTQRVTELSFSLEDRYDSNVARLDETRAAARGLARSDARTTPSIQLDIARPLGRNTLAFHAEAGYDFYHRNRQLNRERLSLGGDAVVATGPCQLTLAPTFSRHQSDLADIALLATPGIDSVRNTETVQDYSGELRCGQRYGLRPLVTGERSTGDNSNLRRRISNYRSWRYGTGLGYTNPVLGDFAVRFNRDETSYPDRPAVLRRSAFTTNRAEFTAKRDIGAVLTASGGLSYISLHPDQGGVKRFSGLGWNLALAAVPLPDLRLTAGLSRDVTPSLGTDALYQVGETYSVGANYALNRRLSFALSGDINRRNYVGAGTTFGPALTNSVQHTVTGTTSFTPSRRLSFAIDLGYQTRNANGTVYDYNDFFAALRTKLTL